MLIVRKFLVHCLPIFASLLLISCNGSGSGGGTAGRSGEAKVPISVFDLDADGVVENSQFTFNIEGFNKDGQSVALLENRNLSANNLIFPAWLVNSAADFKVAINLSPDYYLDPSSLVFRRGVELSAEDLRVAERTGVDILVRQNENGVAYIDFIRLVEVNDPVYPEEAPGSVVFTLSVATTDSLLQEAMNKICNYAYYDIALWDDDTGDLLHISYTERNLQNIAVECLDLYDPNYEIVTTADYYERLKDATHWDSQIIFSIDEDDTYVTLQDGVTIMDDEVIAQ